MFKVVIFLAMLAFAYGGVIAPVVPVAHVAHPVVAHPVAVSHTSSVVHHPVRLVHAAPVVHAPLVHAPVVPVVRHAPIIAVHH
ncbi:larval/pupal cuticle protein H1C-like [Pectinophora gossypiella]|uniref:larval/pupal cuticle protein H1C-like n=1 Tax=Pectinophora gossypiella TaxID=13191 RepID=UPI00214EA316|nr:larval/pupal cuticle protein H1C-like [Pectinophora gossypiella]